MGSKRTGKKHKGKKNDSKKKSQWNEDALPDSNEEFAFIAGYTSWGFPYGVRWDELPEDEQPEGKKELKEDVFFEEDLPFD